MYLFINGTNRTTNLLHNSLDISDELQERVDTCSFLLVGINPSYYDDVKVFEGFPILSASSTSVTLDFEYSLCLQNNLFRVGDIVTIAIGESDEETGEVLTIVSDSGNTKLTFATFANTPSVWELAGRKKFAWNIIDIKDKNNAILENIEFEVTALDYTRIFDKRLINDTYRNRDGRYIVNDFCNVTVNPNLVLDQFDYATTAALRVKWIESGDGGNPTLDTTDERETTWAGNFMWTFSSWTATFSNAITSIDISSFIWADTGSPTKWRIGFWYKATDYSKITNFVLRVGSDSSNYIAFTVTPTENEWVYFDEEFTEWVKTGTPNWEAVDYLAIVITETADSSLKIDGIRVLENSFFRHYPYVQTSTVFDDFRINRVKPTEVMQRIADNLAWYWFIDYDKHIHLFEKTTTVAPISVTEDSNNFRDLQITYDTSRLINRQVVRWAEETSTEVYSQVVEGDGVVREWIMKNKFKGLSVKFDDGSSTDTAEAGTNTTTINATGHGLEIGDYIVNRTRSNAVRRVLTTPSLDSFTVEAVTGQTNWDTFSLFVAKLVGVEGINQEAWYDYMSNYNEKSIRNADSEPTIKEGEFLLFSYNEVIPILVQRTNNVSVTNMRNVLWYTDWLFEWQPIIDRTLTSRTEALKTAEAVLLKYSNVIITAEFSTNQEWLESGQLIRIKDTTSSERNINQDFLIQSVKMKQVAWGENIYQVKCSSLLYGMLELLQQILASGRKIKVDEDEIINNIDDMYETIIILETLVNDVDGDHHIEIFIIEDQITNDVIEPPFQWWPWGSPQLRWNMWAWW